MPKKKQAIVPKPRKAAAPKKAVLAIDEQFKRHAANLVGAVSIGLDIHRAGNIAESGDPLEISFRRLFSQALPNTFETCTGFFFDSALQLSNQCDLLICDQTEILRLPPADGLAQKYVPYNCVRVMGQVKNSFSDLPTALKQSAKAISAWRGMEESGDHQWADDVSYEPLAIIVIGKGGTEAEARKFIEAAPEPWPAYILLVEAGILYAPEDSIRFFAARNGLFYSGQGNDRPLVLVESPTQPKNDAGRLLMRLFFAILAHAGKDTNAFKALVAKVEHDFPLGYADSPKPTKATPP
nr:DUF6602 domain-containing protein [uncultured Roseateles sp.]